MRQSAFVMRSLSFIVCIVILLFYYPRYAHATASISSGSNLPQFKLNAPDDIEARQYLGLKDLKVFYISQLSAKLILIEVFSFYCPICHKQAPVANRLYKFIQQDPKLRKDIKMIAIGAGNSQKEIEVYKANFRVPFPLFSDLDFQIHKKIGEPRTPFTILVTNKGKVLLTHEGVIEDLDEFIQKINKFHAQQ